MEKITHIATTFRKCKCIGGQKDKILRHNKSEKEKKWHQFGVRKFPAEIPAKKKLEKRMQTKPHKQTCQSVNNKNGSI